MISDSQVYTIMLMALLGSVLAIRLATTLYE
jgi:photosystem I reaction center subunit XII